MVIRNLAEVKNTLKALFPEDLRDDETKVIDLGDSFGDVNEALHFCSLMGKCKRQVHYKSLGCWRDKVADRAVPTLEGTSNKLDGDYRLRNDAIIKCYEAAFKRGFEVFVVQHGGWCASSANAGGTYNKYGESERCENGKGGPDANDVYQITGPYISLGCWRESGMTTLEYKDEVLDGRAFRRDDAVRKCFEAARKRGYKMFAVTNLGWCNSSPTAEDKYKERGTSNECRDGIGSTSGASDMYQITE